MKKNRESDIGSYTGIMGKMWLTMKLLFCFLLIGLSTVYGSTFAQVKVSISVRDASLQKVFEKLTDLTGYHFVYSSDMLRQTGKVSIEFQDQNLDQVLAACLKNTGLWYRLEDNIVVISPKFEQPYVPQKKITFSGNVRDKSGMPLPGVTILLKGSTLGVVSDVEGNFRLTVPEASEITLVFSFVGMKTQEIVCRGTEPLRVVMEEDVSQMEEVVVTGYYTLSKERSAGSFSRVEAADINMKTSSGIVERLNGLVPGFVVNNAGEDKFLLRGATSINSSREPLFVVDGMPVELTTLDGTVSPEDIASVSVLKDATAASIWGAKAANGVVVITTKRGRTQGKMNVSYAGSVQIQGLPDFGYLDYMNARDYVDFAVSVYDPTYNYANTLSSYGKISPIERILYNQQQGTITADQAKQELDKLRNSDNRKQIEDYLYRLKTVHQHNLNITGGGESTAYFFSVDYRNSKLQQKGINEDRIIFDLKNDFQITRWLGLSLSANVALTNNKSGYVPNVVGMIPYERLADDEGKPLSQFHMFYSDETQEWLDRQLDDRDMSRYDFVMLKELDKQKNRNKVINTRLQAALRLDLLKGLKFESQFQYQRGYGKSERLDKPDSYWVLNLRAEQTPITDGSVSRIPQGAVLDKTWTENMEWITRNQFVYDRKFRNKHQFNLLVGTEIRKNVRETDNRIVYGYNEANRKFIELDQNAMNAGVPGGTIIRPTSTASQTQAFGRGFGSGFLGSDNRFFSLYANTAYDFNERYGINASMRMDQANLFGTDVRYKPIWSAGVLWNLHKEKFFGHSGFDRLTLRFSKGIAGNTPNSEIGGPYDIISYGFMSNYSFAQTKPYVTISSPALKNLKWEKTNITNFGVDFSVLQGKLSGSLDVYHKNTMDLIGKRTIDPTNGFSTISTNIGKMKNTGIELVLNSINIKTPAFMWTTGFNFSYNKNKITDIYVEPRITDYAKSYAPVFVQGYEAYSLFSYRWAGLNDEGEPMVYDENGNATAGQVTDIKALVHAGTAQPPFTGSLSNTFTYKNFRLSVLAIYNLGHKLFNDVAGQNTNSRVLYSQIATEMNTAPWLNPLHNDYRKAWKQPGDEAKTDVPRWLPQGATRVNASYYSCADINVINGSYIYISDITLSYRLPAKILKDLGLRECMLSAQVANPFCWTFNGEGVDPRYIKSMVGGGRTLKYGPEYMLKLNISF